MVEQRKKTGFVFDRENVFGRFLQLIEREHLFNGYLLYDNVLKHEFFFRRNANFFLMPKINENLLR